MSRLWIRQIKNHRIDKQLTVPCVWGEQHDALREACREMDFPCPIWLDKHENEFESFRRTSFTADHFIESISCDRLEIEFLDDTGKKRKSNDPRNDFSF